MIKFNSSNLPSFVIQDYLVNDLQKGIQVIGYRHTKLDLFVEDGDYLDGESIIYKKNVYEADDLIRQQIHESIGREVIRDLYKTLRQQNLTQAQEGDLLGRLNGTLIALGFGFVRAARVLANNLTVAGQLTQARKDYLVGRIDTAILLL
jgi:hypothetical protein